MFGQSIMAGVLSQFNIPKHNRPCDDPTRREIPIAWAPPMAQFGGCTLKPLAVAWQWPPMTPNDIIAPSSFAVPQHMTLRSNGTTTLLI